MIIEIDKNSGFCFGVVNAIKRAEEELLKEDKLYCLGDIVHNNVEVERLEKQGLITIDHEQFKQLRDCKVLIRAHGEPPETYQIAKEYHITLIDASCPVVLTLQKKIKKGFHEISLQNGQLVIYGKAGHAEVNGLVGQTDNKAIVVSNIGDLDKVDFSKPINLFSQTTQSIDDYKNIVSEITKRLKENGLSENNLHVNQTICGQVSNRNKELKLFAQKHDVILFVSGKKSSNGKVLFDYCKQQNEKTYFISDTNDIQSEWLKDIKSVGICGATSTPRWLMEKIRDFLQ